MTRPQAWHGRNRGQAPGGEVKPGREEQGAGTGGRGHGHQEVRSVRKSWATMFWGPQILGFYPKPPEEFKQGTHMILFMF